MVKAYGPDVCLRLSLNIYWLCRFEEKSLPFAEPQFLICQMGQWAPDPAELLSVAGADKELKF